MATRGKGSIINIGSMAGQLGLAGGALIAVDGGRTAI